MLGFAGAFRKSEVVALNVEDLAFCDEGVRITIRRSKTDQEGQGQTIAILPGAGRSARQAAAGMAGRRGCAVPVCAQGQARRGQDFRSRLTAVRLSEDHIRNFHSYSTS